MISFSTCWNSHRHKDGQQLCWEIMEMGFDTIEVSHGLKISLLPGIKKAYQEGQVKVSGIHNFCPSPVEVMIDAPDAYEFTSFRPHERTRARELTLRSLQTAAEFGAKYLVVHLGSIPMKPYTSRLEEIAKGGGTYGRKFVKTKLKFIEAREKQAPRYLRRAQEALEELSEAAGKNGVKLAVESRSHFEQVPSEREMRELMTHFADDPNIGYWHDFGHVQRKANLSLLDHEAWLREMQPHLIGCHLHDVRWPATDHRVPLSVGGVDYKTLMPLVTPEKPVVWELSPRRKKSQIVECLGLWRQQYGY